MLHAPQSSRRPHSSSLCRNKANELQTFNNIKPFRCAVTKNLFFVLHCACFFVFNGSKGFQKPSTSESVFADDDSYTIHSTPQQQCQDVDDCVFQDTEGFE